MANPQHEDGSIKIAYGLYGSLIQANLTAIQLRIMLAVIALSYGRNQKKAIMSLEDIRSLMGTYSTDRKFRVVDGLANLVEMNMLIYEEVGDETYKLGPQKDYDLWISRASPNAQDLSTNAKNLQLLRSCFNSITNNNIHSMPQKICRDAYLDFPVKHEGKQLLKEIAKAREIYGQALIKLRVPSDAAYLVLDFIEDSKADWLKNKLRIQYIFAYASRSYRQYFDMVPEKKLDTIRDEKALGVRHKYDLKAKRWVPTKEKLGG